MIRASSLLEGIVKIVPRLEGAVIELPEIIYAGGKSQKQILSQASCVIETSVMASCMWTFLRKSGLSVAFVRPREWQMGAKRPRGVDSKTWSLTVANHILAGQGESNRLKTKEDENVADAITMGHLLIPKIMLGTLQFS